MDKNPEEGVFALLKTRPDSEYTREGQRARSNKKEPMQTDTHIVTRSGLAVRQLGW